MRIILPLLLLFGISFTSCDSMKTYDVNDLYGSWQGDVWAFTFNEDGSCMIANKGNALDGENTWRQVSMGNTLELVHNGKVFMANVTVKGIENDVLTLEMRPMIGGGKSELATEIHELKRVTSGQ